MAPPIASSLSHFEQLEVGTAIAPANGHGAGQLQNDALADDPSADAETDAAGMRVFFPPEGGAQVEHRLARGPLAAPCEEAQAWPSRVPVAGLGDPSGRRATRRWATR